MNYGCNIDFDLLEIDEQYQEGIINCVHDFAEIHRPDLLSSPVRKRMLLDWARLGFNGCKLLNKDIPQVLVDYQYDEFQDKKRTYQCAGPLSPSIGFIETKTPSSFVEKSCSETPIFPKKIKLSLQITDSKYSSPNVSKLLACSSASSYYKTPTKHGSRNPKRSSSEINTFVLGKLPKYGWWPGSVCIL